MLWNGNERGKKAKVMRISRQQFPVKNYDRPKNNPRMWNLLNIWVAC
jgi:hypothetical protein